MKIMQMNEIIGLVKYKTDINKIIHGGAEELQNMINAYESIREGMIELVRDLKAKLQKEVDEHQTTAEELDDVKKELEKTKIMLDGAISQRDSYIRMSWSERPDYANNAIKRNNEELWEMRKLSQKS